MTYEEAMHFWFGRVNYEQKTPHVGDFKLERMRQLLLILGNPHERLRIIHIAGSKGKGSTSAMLASILQHSGHIVGLFTSPHLVEVEERIQVNQTPITRPEITAVLNEIRDRVPESLLGDLTFFEIGTALGFLHFVRRRVDFAVVEVGLGGRFDSTNVCTPLVSVITSISFDHTQILGDTLAKIAFEKAGIIKPGRPTISGVRDAEARHVIIQTCAERSSPLNQIDVDFGYAYEPAIIDFEVESWPSVQVTTRQHAWPAMKLRLVGEHQARNAAVAVATVEALVAMGVVIGERAVSLGLSRVVWPARLEIISPRVLLDCAHNVASAQALVQVLEESFPVGDRIEPKRILIFGGNRDKDLTGMLKVLAPWFDQIYLTSIRGSTRCMSPAEVAALLPADKRAGSMVFADAWHALCRAHAEAGPNDTICITGSVFLAGELRPRIAELFGR